MAPARVYAANSTEIEQQYFPNLPIVLSATRLPQPVQDSPVAVTVITRNMIKASGATEIPDLLRLVPGFLVDYDNAHTAAVSYHMLPDRYVRQQQVLIDGRSVYDPLLGGVPWMELPITIDDIERIEVIRGPDAATYGSNSFLGVINIITRHAILDKGTTVKTNLGSDGLREGFVRYGNSSGALDYRLNMAYRSDNGFDGRYDGKIVRLLNSRFDYQANNQDNMVMKAGYSTGPRQMDDTFDSGVPSHDSHIYSQYQQVKWRHVSAAEDEYSIQAYHNQLNINDSYTRTDYPIKWDAGTSSDRYDIEIQKLKRISPKLRYVVGASYRLDQVASKLYFGTTKPFQNRIRRLFAHGEYHYSKSTLLNLGVMYENNDITGVDVSPQASLNYRLTHHDTLRIGISKADRTPVLVEQYPNEAVNIPGYYNQLVYNGRSINNEHITEYDIGFVGQHMQNKFNYDLKFYYQDIQGLINIKSTTYSDADGTADYFGNFDNAIIRGVETGIDWKPSTRSKIHLAYAYIDISSTDHTESYSTAAPKSVLNLLAMHNFPYGYSGSVNIYYRSSMKPLARRSYDPPFMDPYTRVDMRFAKQFETGNTHQTLAIVIRNMFNARQHTRLKNNVDRGAYLTYQVKFN
jgi:iron complex outermembrane recepter protein